MNISAVQSSIVTDEIDKNVESFEENKKSSSCDDFSIMMLSNYLQWFGYEEIFNYRQIRTALKDVCPKFAKEFDAIYDSYVTKVCGDSSHRPYISTADYINEFEFIRTKKILLQELKERADKNKFEIYPSIQYISDIFQFGKYETIFLQYVYFTQTYEYERGDYTDLAKLIKPYTESLDVFLSKAFEIPKEICKKILSPSSDLMLSGVLNSSTSSDRLSYKLITPLQNLITPDSVLTDEILEASLFPSMLDTELDISDYHQTSDIDIMCNLINHSLMKKTNGINILLWGLPGTGKTELSLILAEKHEWNLKVIGDIGKSDLDEKSRTSRLFSLNIAQRIFAKNNKNIVLLFDEMEDLFKFDNDATHSKAFINRIIEKTSVPIIWTTNSMHALGAAAIRRMTFTIPFDSVPPEEKRKHIWQKYLKKYDKDFSDAEIQKFAQKFDVVPALIANMAKVASCSNLTSQEVDRVMINMDKAMNLGDRRTYCDTNDEPALFNVLYSNTDIDLNRLTNKILETGRKNFNILSYGPSGTGKSAFAIHLAKEMKMKYRIKQASELISMWIGETERNIAKMFEDAITHNEFIILDEADSFFQNRSSAVRSWEVTQVNEMLVGMEKHTLPFVCTTNLEGMIDPAAFRRFTFKIKYDYIDLQQREKLYEVYFKRSAPNGVLRRMNQLAPGDFANIYKKMEFLGDISDDEIIKMLETEQEIKPSFRNKMGF